MLCFLRSIHLVLLYKEFFHYIFAKPKKRIHYYFMKLSLFLSLFFLCISSTVFSQENEVEPVIKKHPLAFNGYSGGMQLHIGYVQGQTFNVYGNSGNVIQQITPDRKSVV